jgi:small subunit ribosomal protein S2
MTKQDLLKQLQNTGGHIGYSKTRRHASVKPFLATLKGGRDIINLDKTVEQIEAAAEALANMVRAKKPVFIVGIKPEAREKVRNMGMLTSQPFAAERFIGGTLTNFGEIKKRVDRLADFTTKKEKGEFNMYTKKEQVMIDRDIERMTKNFGGLSGITQLPAMVLMVDSRFESIVHDEALYLRLPTVALCNTDCDIKKVDFPIVMNEASAGAIGVVLAYLSEVMQKAAAEKPVEKVFAKPVGHMDKPEVATN